ncbi:MAG TPA: alpha/beta fold hydrolase [Acidimicrobiales bacterium]|nr:alpha/beta fold hydrolase [Acidimicrobiales bacterium]
MASTPAAIRLRAAQSPVTGLALYEHRVADPVATLVCVHGGLDRGGSFSRLARRLDTVDVVAYDRRGYQASRALGPAPLDAHVADLAAIASAEDRPVALFGHSFGGLVALATADRHPGLACLVVTFESPLPWVLARVSGRPEPTDDPGHEAEVFFRRVVSDAGWERLSEAERDSRRADGPALLADLSTLGGPAPVDVTRLATPFALLYGDGALGPYYRALAARVAEVAPKVRCVELPGASHGAHLGAPGPLARALLPLIEDACASG